MGTHYRGTPEEIRVLDTFIKLVRAANSMGERSLRHLSEFGLNESQFAVLEAVAALGPLCQKDIAKKILKSKANITVIVDALEARKLLKRERSQEDRRYMDVHLTVEGRQLIDQVFPLHLRNMVEEMSILTPEEQQELGRLCRILGRKERPS